MNIRESIIEAIDLLAHHSKQIEYERNVPHANIVSELFCCFSDDLYHPKSEEMLSLFTEDELKGLAHLYGVLAEAACINNASSVSELLKHPKWRSVTAVAKELNAYYCSHPPHGAPTTQ